MDDNGVTTPTLNGGYSSSDFDDLFNDEKVKTEETPTIQENHKVSDEVKLKKPLTKRFVADDRLNPIWINVKGKPINSPLLAIEKHARNYQEN